MDSLGAEERKKTIALQECAAVIELPRLRLHFHTSLHGEGDNIRISSAEHSGLFIVTSAEAEVTSAPLDERTGIEIMCSVTPHSILLADDEGNRYLVRAHRIIRTY
jgi:hypothetical protein